jgi:hypothetical protein
VADVYDVRSPFPGRCCDTPSVQFVGYMGGAPLGSCVRPSSLFCVHCQCWGETRCNSSRRSVCSGCAAQYRGRVSAVAERGIVLVPAGYGVMVTLTAPGNEVHWLPSGDQCECTPAGGVDLAEWNASLTARRNRFIEALRRGEAAPRVGGARRRVDIEYFGAKESQRRGALHCHELMRRTDGKALQLRTSEVRRLAIAHGFGHSVRIRKVGVQQGVKALSAKGAARYCGKYVGKSSDERARVPWAYGARGARWRTWTASRRWGCSMKELKEEARARAIEGHAAARPDGGTAGRTAAHLGGSDTSLPLDSLTGSYAEELANSPPIDPLVVLQHFFGPCLEVCSGS